LSSVIFFSSLNTSSNISYCRVICEWTFAFLSQLCILFFVSFLVLGLTQ
jgi:hypothetical protein